MTSQNAAHILDNCEICSAKVEHYLPPTLAMSAKDVRRRIAYAIADHRNEGHDAL